MRRTFVSNFMFSLVLALIVLSLSSCVITPPDYIEPIENATATPEPAATNEPTAAPSDALTTTPPPTQTPTENEDEASDASANDDAADIVFAPALERVEMYFPSAASMMGFADLPSNTTYEKTITATLQSAMITFPNAETLLFRYGASIPKADMLIERAVLIQSVTEPSFYLDSPMLTQPERIKPEDKPARQGVELMNEPIASFYDMQGKNPPTAIDGATGTVAALSRRDMDALTIIFTDFSELKSDDGTLISALATESMASGQTLAIIAMTSEFAGYVPDIGANKTAFVWGAPPTGSLDYTLDFTEYKVGVSIDPAKRVGKPRPFYIICLGPSKSVSDAVTMIKSAAEDITGEPPSVALYLNSYLSAGYNMADHMEFLMGQAIIALPDTTAAGGVSRVELKPSKTERFIEWKVEYTPSPDDPRVGRFADTDFEFEARAAGDAEGRTLTGISWVCEETGENVSITLRVEFPQGFVLPGEYQLTIKGLLKAPIDMPGLDWLPEYGFDPEGAQLLEMEQGDTPFIGDKTLFLSRLLRPLGGSHVARLKDEPLGEITLGLNVFN